MVNTNMDQLTNNFAPSDEPCGTLALYVFFVQMMYDSVRGLVVDSEEPIQTDALGFDPVGPIISRRRMQEYTDMLRARSGSAMNDDTMTPYEQASHIIWLHSAVPKALVHAHHLMNDMLRRHRTNEMTDDEGHTYVVKVFMTLLDSTIRDMGRRRMIQQVIHARGRHVHDRHYRSAFGRLAPTLRWYSMTFVMGEGTNEND